MDAGERAGEGGAAVTPILLSSTFALCTALALVIMAGALYLHLLGRRLADASQRLHVARRSLATATEAHERTAWRTEIGHLETEVATIRERIRRVESFL